MMQIESRMVGALNRTPHSSASPSNTEKTLKRVRLDVDTIAASVVIGLTAMFVVALFSLVTDFIPSLVATVLISLFIGLSAGLIAFTLMKS